MIIIEEIKDLSDHQKARILDTLIYQIQEINRKSGTVIGTYELLERLEKIAILKGMVECPICHRKGSG